MLRTLEQASFTRAPYFWILQSSTTTSIRPSTIQKYSSNIRRIASNASRKPKNTVEYGAYVYRSSLIEMVSQP
ncbi:hypothetical protein KPH14_005556 [Odynerus spinipes]|uniref:Uncharacterized protein n=1 Tax=Odynerus spinipes TaxID=1348599 RepID=A0AAD9RCT0_9HYME|nr:hypothetical protein KPH14_005556 [Odynerus spinipes]